MGFVHGAWKIEKKKNAATLIIEPSGTWAAHSRRKLTEEGEQLLRFVEASAKTFEVNVVEP